MEKNKTKSKIETPHVSVSFCVDEIIFDIFHYNFSLTKKKYNTISYFSIKENGFSYFSSSNDYVLKTDYSCTDSYIRDVLKIKDRLPIISINIEHNSTIKTQELFWQFLLNENIFYFDIA